MAIIESRRGISPLSSRGTVLESLLSHGSSCLITNVKIHYGCTNFQCENSQGVPCTSSVTILSNHRIKSTANGKVSFSYKDYAHGGTRKIMTIDAEEFLRRFCLHILPPAFRKIRHYGILASRYKPILKKQLFVQGIILHEKKKEDWKSIAKRKLGFDVDACPSCKTGKMIRIMSFDAHAPPKILLQIQHQQKMKK